jgi:putative hydrolase of the HAD superfamily
MNEVHLPQIEQNEPELALAARYAPRILFDRHEPFTPLAVGYTIFRDDGYSASFPRCIGLNPVGRPPATMAIEYAIWWDWDIHHLYELEHVWTYVDAHDEVVHAEGSWHGDFGTIRHGQDGQLPLHHNTHLIVYSQPGKHAFAPSDEPFVKIMKDYICRQCGEQSKKSGLLITSIFKGILDPYKTPTGDQLINSFLDTQAFEPAFAWDQIFDISPHLLLPWPVLADWIPQRIDWLLEELKNGSD